MQRVARVCQRQLSYLFVAYYPTCVYVCGQNANIIKLFDY